ncbi:response regulator transcription factor [Deinococcus sp. 12RED42]|uniref:response regulator transcription factor n=1 Tax=Deinococcus sp. 12RED42 TaxID=2745872 RepID=UPI001E373470|nr:response regulator transcription factor [Deinococcus sp. 12RED42]MCD0166089.1 response regulator transcription factor [Deinococcus sp. 12RED42]
MAQDASILIVEDDDEIAAALVAYLARAGYRPRRAADGPEALAAYHRERPDLLLLDVMLPGLSGFEVLQLVREDASTPVIILTARTYEADLLHGFRLGADDYVTKPFRPLEVVARVDAVLRRAAPHAGVLRGHGGLCLDPQRHDARLNGAALDLTPSEFILLRTLLRDPGRTFNRDRLAAHLTGEGASERAVDSHIKNLRRKLGPVHSIETVHGIGYRYAEDIKDR